MTKIFKKGYKLSGKFRKHIKKLISAYMELVRYYVFSDTQNIKHFKNLFENNPRHFYWSYVLLTCKTFKEVYIKVQTEYSSSTQQNRMRRCLQTL